jgi:hypothetical protein
MAKAIKRPWAAKYPRAFQYKGGKWFYRHTPQHSQLALRGAPGDELFDITYRTAEQSHRQLMVNISRFVTGLKGK